MKRRSFQAFRVALATLGTFLSLHLAACGGGSSDSTGPDGDGPANDGPSVSTVVVSPTTGILIDLGATLQLTASVQDAQGNTLANRTVSWSSSDPLVVSVPTPGIGTTILVTAESDGTAVVTASSEGRSGAATLEVASVPSDVTGEYFMVFGGVPRYMLTLAQIGQSVSFSLEGGGLAFTGSGTIDGRAISLTSVTANALAAGPALAATPGHPNDEATDRAPSEVSTLTLSLEISSDGSSLTGAWDFMSEEPSNGTVTGSTTPWATYDVASNGLPKLAVANYIDLESIDWVSLFRSSQGHDFSDDFESCSSMKHYFQPREGVDWATIPIRAPFDGIIVGWTDESIGGTAVTIASHAYPAIHATIFHVALHETPTLGHVVMAGDEIGTHIGTQTNSDIAVGIRTPDGYLLVSYFEVMTDQLFELYQARGAAAKSDFIISAAERDADPLTCDDEDFLTSGDLPSWHTFDAPPEFITPFVSEAEMGPINEAYSVDDSAPWGFAHDGVDFFPLGDGSRFQVAAAGTIEFVELWQNGENWQVNVLIRHNERYSSEYGFEPMSGGAATGQAQLARVAVSAGQEVSQGDLLGLLSQVGEGAHVHFRVRDGPESVCPSDLFTEEAQASILRLLHTIWPGATICS